MTLAIVIVSYNTRELLRNCLQSVFAHVPGEGPRVVVVDNASRDGSVEMVRAEFPRSEVIANEANVGYAAAVNQGLRAALADWALILNSDIEVEAGALEGMLRAMAERPRVGMAGPLLVLPDGRVQETWGRGFTLGAYARQQLVGDRVWRGQAGWKPAPPRGGETGETPVLRQERETGGTPVLPKEGGLKVVRGGVQAPALQAEGATGETPVLRGEGETGETPVLRQEGKAGDGVVAVAHLHGAALLVRREALDAVGPLDEGYFMYCEDSDWCLRFRRAGWELALVTGARMLHHHGASSRQTRAEMIAAYNRAAQRYFRLHYGPLEGLLARLLGLLGVSLRLLGATLGTMLTLGMYRPMRARAALFFRTLDLMSRRSSRCA